MHRRGEITFSIPNVYATIYKTSRDTTSIMVVGTGADGDPARFAEHWLDNCLLLDFHCVP